MHEIKVIHQITKGTFLTIKNYTSTTYFDPDKRVLGFWLIISSLKFLIKLLKEKFF